MAVISIAVIESTNQIVAGIPEELLLPQIFLLLYFLH